MDHIYIRQPHNYCTKTTVLQAGNILTDISGHYANYILYPIGKSDTTESSLESKQQTRRIFSTKNINNYRTCLLSVDWDEIFSCTDVNRAFDIFHAMILNLYELNFPMCIAS